jgi:hypothetical protein
MATINEIIRPEYSQLAYDNTDMMVNLAYNAAFPAMGVTTETGQFRVGDATINFAELKADMNKHSTALTYNFGDSLQTYFVTPQAVAFELSNGDLQQPQIYGYMNRNEMIQSRVITFSQLLKKKKEKTLYTFISDNSNFASSSYYANASVAWSTHATADPVSDVATGKAQCPEANALLIPYGAYLDLQQCSKLQSLTSVSGSKRNISVDPTITIEWLANVFQVQYVFVSRGRFITDSSDPTDTTKADLFGRKALLFYHNPNMNDKDGRWMKHLYWNVEGASTDEGWIVTEKFNPETGLVGMYRWQVGSYYQYLSHNAALAYRIDSI